MELLDSIRKRAAKYQKTIVFPEGTEPRTLQAMKAIVEQGIAQPVLLGHPKDIEIAAKQNNADISGCQIVNPLEEESLEYFTSLYYEMRKNKGVNREMAKNIMEDPLYFASMMVKVGYADGEVAGAHHTTSSVLRPALQILRTEAGIGSISGAMIMIVPDCKYGEHGVFVFADCGVTPVPTGLQMAEFAWVSARTARNICGISDPKVGMLSFSTKGSASHPVVDKVRHAIGICHEQFPDLKIDGELQGDAAIVPDIAARKAPGSLIAGQCNVLIFPNLQAGNICYKLTQRLANAVAIGPVLQGIASPVNDLSRGCSAEDIVNETAITVLQTVHSTGK